MFFGNLAREFYQMCITELGAMRKCTQRLWS